MIGYWIGIRIVMCSNIFLCDDYYLSGREGSKVRKYIMDSICF